jgi:hypothetical protein
MTRTDNHRVSKIIPADYTYLFSFAYSGAAGDPSWNTQLLAATKRGADSYQEPVYGFSDWGSPVIIEMRTVENPFGKLEYFDKSEHGSEAWGGCDVCGTPFRYGDVWQHVSGECIVLGHQCAEKYGLLADRDAFHQFKREEAQRRKAAAAATARAIERTERFCGLMEWARENRDLLPLLKVSHDITQDMRGKLIRTGARWGLSEKQTALLKKLEADSKKPREKYVPVPVDDERIRVEGWIVGCKVQEGYYGDTLKIVVKVDEQDGCWLVYGTASEALCDLTGDKPLKGHKVAFMAKVKKGDRDEHFGFFSRPTKVEVLDYVKESN